MNRLSAMRNFRISTHSTMSTTTLPGYTEYESPLPTYTCLYPLPQEIPDEGTDAHTEHIFHLNKRLGAPSQGTLTLISHASNPNDIPLIYSGGILKGSVNCELKEPATIRRISVIVSCRSSQGIITRAHMHIQASRCHPHENGRSDEIHLLRGDSLRLRAKG